MVVASRSVTAPVAPTDFAPQVPPLAALAVAFTARAPAGAPTQVPLPDTVETALPGHVASPKTDTLTAPQVTFCGASHVQLPQARVSSAPA
jgi:hypothetical protein